ncbi:MAG: hypothetical protein CVV27_01925 [Candidatus Melainabacteria bacterium HGW-Melainabacteria-1]|nr:MAG: hypothetical protein CVV27_01925 [Candidatus Melainabacteria bacterium HGW-Melainabacteria-1]
MADRANKIVAIFGNHMVLNKVLDDLNQSGFNRDEISVLVKNNADGVETDTDNDVRTYSTSSYPSATLERPVLDRTDTNWEQDRVDDTMDRSIGYDPLVGEPVPGRDFRTPMDPVSGVDAGTAYNRDSRYQDRNVADEELIGDKVNVNRDTGLEDDNDVKVKDPNALIKDSVKGGTIGMLAGAAALLIPGIGPVIAAGPIAAAIAALATGAAVGTTAGAMVGLFKDEGIPADRIDTYRAAFEAGKAVVIIKPKNEQDEMTELNLARSIFNRHNPELVELIA